MHLRGLKRFFRSGAPSPEDKMPTPRELQGKHDAVAEVSEIPSPESELATPPDEHIFELPHERSLRGKESDTVILPERKREIAVPATAGMPEALHERERSHNVPSANTIPDLSHEQALRPQQTESNATAVLVPECSPEKTASVAENPKERGLSATRPETFTSANDIVPSTDAVPESSHKQASHPQQTKPEIPTVPGPERAGDDIVAPAANMAEIAHERGIRTNLPNISTNQTSDQKFAPVFDESPGEGAKPVIKPQDEPVERKDSALAQSSTDTSGVPPLQIKDKLKKLVPYATALSIRDLDRCFALEQDCFFGRNYCTKEQLAYRLTHGSSYSVGIFVSTTAASSPVATFKAARFPDSSEPKRRALLIGHIIATKTNNDRISDADLQIGGHRNDGTNLAINNIAVLYDYRRQGVFSLLIKEFVIRMHQAAVAEKLLLLSRGPYIPLFQHMKFEYRGQSSLAIGDENWYDMAIVFKDLGAPLSPSKYEPAEEEDEAQRDLLRPMSRHGKD